MTGSTILGKYGFGFATNSDNSKNFVGFKEEPEKTEEGPKTSDGGQQSSSSSSSTIIIKQPDMYPDKVYNLKLNDLSNRFPDI